MLGVVLVGQRLGVLLPEGCEAREELLRVGLVERRRLAQFGDGIGERLLLVGVEVGVLRRGLGERIEAPAQVGERGLEGASVAGTAALSAQTRPR